MKLKLVVLLSERIAGSNSWKCQTIYTLYLTKKEQAGIPKGKFKITRMQLRPSFLRAYSAKLKALMTKSLINNKHRTKKNGEKKYMKSKPGQ